jgi:hypothetical protein
VIVRRQISYFAAEKRGCRALYGLCMHGFRLNMNCRCRPGKFPLPVLIYVEVTPMASLLACDDIAFLKLGALSCHVVQYRNSVNQAIAIRVCGATLLLRTLGRTVLEKLGIRNKSLLRREREGKECSGTCILAPVVLHVGTSGSRPGTSRAQELDIIIGGMTANYHRCSCSGTCVMRDPLLCS